MRLQREIWLFHQGDLTFSRETLIDKFLMHFFYIKPVWIKRNWHNHVCVCVHVCVPMCTILHVRELRLLNAQWSHNFIKFWTEYDVHMCCLGFLRAECFDYLSSEHPLAEICEMFSYINGRLCSAIVCKHDFSSE